MTKTYPAADRTYDAKVSGEAGLTASLLGPIGAVGSASLNLGGGRSRVSQVSFSNGSFVFMEDGNEDAIVSYAKNNIRPRPDSRYLVVRDVVNARGIDINLSEEDKINLGGEVGIKKIVEIKPNFKYNRSNSYLIKGNFDTPINVCIRAVELRPIGMSGKDWEISKKYLTGAELTPLLVQSQPPVL